MTETSKHFTAEQKVAILRRHLLEHVLVSDLCDERGIQPSVFCCWQQQLFENGAAAFARQSKGVNDVAGQKIKALKKLVRQNEILSELMEGYVRGKKSLGMPRAGLGSTGHPRRRGGLPALLVGASGYLHHAGAPLAGHPCQQIH